MPSISTTWSSSHNWILVKLILKPDYEGATIGQVFIDFSAEMKEVYTPYYRNHDDAMAHLEKLNEDQEFCQAVQMCLDNVK